MMFYAGMGIIGIIMLVCVIAVVASAIIGAIVVGIVLIVKSARKRADNSENDILA